MTWAKHGSVMQLLHASKQKEKKSKQISRMCPQILSLMKKKKDVLAYFPEHDLWSFKAASIKEIE